MYRPTRMWSNTSRTKPVSKGESRNRGDSEGRGRSRLDKDKEDRARHAATFEVFDISFDDGPSESMSSSDPRAQST